MGSRVESKKTTYTSCHENVHCKQRKWGEPRNEKRMEALTELMRKLQVNEKGVEDMVIREDVIPMSISNLATVGVNMEEVDGNEGVKNKINGKRWYECKK
ncbi:uncharacterized protein G2W53_022502 [Senna tora]|uniref:Uncharacterized protein n=1 Tax=Senna tora TaxID=362788 RepID=A0A834WKK0_9FABA|nr:uncharacterized protein G2W53_022502 [Senna tora]